MRFCMLNQENAGMGDEDESFLLQPDGICHRIDLIEEHLMTLFDYQLSLMSESTTLVFVEGGSHQRTVMSKMHIMTNQDRVIKILDRIANSSYLKFPAGETEEEHIAQKLEFVFDGVHGGNTNALVMPMLSGEFTFFVGDVSEGQEK